MKIANPQSMLCLVVSPPEIKIQYLTKTSAGLTTQVHRLTPSLRLTADDPELVGRELRQLMQQAGIPRRKAIVLLPSAWFQSLQVPLEGIPAEDQDSYVHLQAERFFGTVDAHQFSHQIVTFPDGRAMALAIAFPSERMAAVTAALRVAGLPPLLLAPLATFPAPPDGDGTVISLSSNHLEVGIFVHGIPVAFRSLAAETSPETLVRELRLTLSGSGCTSRKLFFNMPVQEPLSSLLRQSGFQQHTLPEPWDGSYAGAGAAMLCMQEKGTLPYSIQVAPAMNALGALLHSRRRLFTGLAVVAGLVALILLVAIGRTGYCRYLEMKLAKQQPQVEKLETIRVATSRMSPWVRANPEMLMTLKRIIDAFPDEGTVWLERLDIRASNEVFLTGSARNTTAWYSVQEKLSKTSGVEKFRMQQLRVGEKGAGLQFSVTFVWDSKRGLHP
jgi:Tfp pilus assembly protein PilN